MKYFILFFALNIATFNGLSCAADETEFKTVCVKTTCMDTYNATLKTIESSSGLGNIAMQWAVEAAYTTEQTIKVTLSFKDSKDAGLLVLNNPGGCIEIALFKRIDLLYKEEQKIANQITSKYLDDQQKRQISFEIVDQDFDSLLIQDKSQLNEITYFGYFNLKFTISSQLLLVLRIQFQLTILNQIQKSSVTSLQLVKDDSNCDQDNNCITLVPSTLQYCTNQACTSYTDTLKLVVNQSVYIKQTLVASAIPSAYLDKPTIFIRGSKMFKEMPVKSVTPVKTEGAIIIELQPAFVYTDVTLIVDSHVLINYQQLVSTQHLEPAHSVVQTATFDCIYYDKKSTICPSCAEQDKYSTMTSECMQKKMSCASDETIVNGICQKESCQTNYQERLKKISVSSSIELNQEDLYTTFYFDDIESDGLMYNDNSESCIKNKLYRFKSLLYTGEIEDARNMTSYFNTQTNRREWKFIIQKNEFPNILIIDNNNGTISYTGFYSHQFFVGQQVLLIYNFNFKIQVSSGTSGSTVTSSTPRVIYGKASCNSDNKCIQTATSDLKICNTKECTETSEKKEFLLNDPIYLKQIITLDGFLDWSLKLIQAEFKSDGLQRTVEGTQVSSGKGYIVIELLASFAYNKYITIVVNSELEAPSGRLLMNRILVTESKAQANQESPAFCIKEQAESKCDDTTSEKMSFMIQMTVVIVMLLL